LLDGSHSDAKHFYSNIIKYNQAFAFTSLGCNISINTQRGPPVFHIQGELSHLTKGLVPGPTNTVYAQIYIFDQEQAVKMRLENNKKHKLQSTVVRSLENMLRECNPYVNIYQNVYQYLAASPYIEDAKIILCATPGANTHTHNLPTVNEVAMILPGEDNAGTTYRDIVISLHGGHLLHIFEGHPVYLPLHYPLLFAHGEPGWHCDMTAMTHTGTETKVSLIQFASFCLHQHPNDIEYSALLHGGRLLQTFVVDVFAAAEQSRLRFLCLNQPKLQADSYANVAQALSDDINLGDIGICTVLPATHTSSPRHIYGMFQDGLAIAHHFQKLDLFITVTANP
jgi:hypothetical protein